MAKQKNNRSMWEDDFQDISSDSHRQPSRAPARGRSGENRSGSRRPVDFQIPPWDGGGRDRPQRTSRDQRSREWTIPEWNDSDWNRETRKRQEPPLPEEKREKGARSDKPGTGRKQSARPRPAGVVTRSGRSRSSGNSQKRSKKPLSAGARKLMAAVTILIMVCATVLLAAFMLFKVSEIQITGDTIEGCQQEDILAICGYKAGNNLLFISTGDKEKKLKAGIPYIEEVKISRHLPGTIEIHLTAAQVAACVAQGDSWLYLNGGGKVLERQDKPLEGVMRVSGLELPETEVGQVISIKKPEQLQESGEESSSGSAPAQKQDADYEKALQTYNGYEAYKTVAAKLVKAEAVGDFTSLDLSDLSNITMLYRDRIQFLLGSPVELEYKIDLGLRSVAKLEEENPNGKSTGTLDLTYADESKKAFWAEGGVFTGNDPTASADPNGGTPAASPSPSPNPREEGIPDSLYDGKSTPKPTAEPSNDDAGDYTDYGYGGDYGNDYTDNYTDDYTDGDYAGDDYTDDYTDDGYTGGDTADDWG